MSRINTEKFLSTAQTQKKHAGGRPTKYKQEYCKLIVKMSSENHGEPISNDSTISKFPMSFTQFADFIGVTREIMYDWIDRHKEFRHAARLAYNAHYSWFCRQLQQGLWERSHKENGKMSSLRFNTHCARLYAWMHFRISERSIDDKQERQIPAAYYDPATTTEEKYVILDKCLIYGIISPSTYKIMQEVIDMRYNEQNAEKILQAESTILDAKKEVEKIS